MLPTAPPGQRERSNEWKRENDETIRKPELCPVWSGTCRTFWYFSSGIRGTREFKGHFTSNIWHKPALKTQDMGIIRQGGSDEKRQRLKVRISLLLWFWPTLNLSLVSHVSQMCNIVVVGWTQRNPKASPSHGSKKVKRGKSCKFVLVLFWIHCFMFLLLSELFLLQIFLSKIHSMD